MMHLWYESAGEKATGNNLEKALKKIKREDVVQKCMYNIMTVTDTTEREAAKLQLDQSGFEAFKEELGPSRDSTLQKGAKIDGSYAESAEESGSETSSVVERSKVPVEKLFQDTKFGEEFQLADKEATPDFERKDELSFEEKLEKKEETSQEALRKNGQSVLETCDVNAEQKVLSPENDAIVITSKENECDEILLQEKHSASPLAASPVGLQEKIDSPTSLSDKSPSPTKTEQYPASKEEGFNSKEPPTVTLLNTSEAEDIVKQSVSNSTDAFQDDQKDLDNAPCPNMQSTVIAEDLTDRPEVNEELAEEKDNKTIAYDKQERSTENVVISKIEKVDSYDLLNSEMSNHQLKGETELEHDSVQDEGKPISAAKPSSDVQTEQQDPLKVEQLETDPEVDKVIKHSEQEQELETNFADDEKIILLNGQEDDSNVASDVVEIPMAVDQLESTPISLNKEVYQAEDETVSNIEDVKQSHLEDEVKDAMKESMPEVVTEETTLTSSDGKIHDTRVVMKKKVHKKTTVKDGKEETIVTTDTHVEHDDKGPEDLQAAMKEIIDNFVEGTGEFSSETQEK